MLEHLQIPSPLEKMDTYHGVEIWLKRDDLIHPEVSGNKWRKLKYYLEEFQRQGKTDLLTFGGAFSNHLAATAAAGKIFDIPTHALVRGEEIGQNPTLDYCRKQGMRIETISRSKYKLKDSPDFLEGLRELRPDIYIIPEGGKGVSGVLGCAEILAEVDRDFDVVCASAGTGTTMAGLLLSGWSSKFWAFSALKGGHFLKRAIAQQLLPALSRLSTSLDGKKVIDHQLIVQDNYHFRGYGKVDETLIDFLNRFYQKYQIKLDPVYTGKMMYGLFDLIERGQIEAGEKVLCLHSGGLQGIAGMNERLRKSNKKTLEYEA